MKILYILIIPLMIFSCESKKQEVQVVNPLLKLCEKSKMEWSDYDYGIDTTKPEIICKSNEFNVIVDTNYKAINYISSNELHWIQELKAPDTSYLYYNDIQWKNLTKYKKIKFIDSIKTDIRETIIDVHNEFNDGNQIVWLINNTKDTVMLETVCFRLICILEAKIIKDYWKPIEYVMPGFDNFSYGYCDVFPNRANFFKAKLPKGGNFKTKLRFKVLSNKRFYYSNEFDGIIDCCQLKSPESKRPFYKLEEFKDIVGRYWPR